METTINALDFADEMSPELRAVALPFVRAPALNTGQQVSCPSRPWMHRTGSRHGAAGYLDSALVRVPLSFA